jgi:acetolactate synthase-1/2/3 large subunit
MGLSIPLAIGAAIADSDAQILAVTGDGSLELNIQELKTMSHYNLNIKLFVINNGGYVSMRNWQDNFFEGRRIESEESTGAGTLQMENIARAFDLPYARIEHPDMINEQLKQIIADDKPMFVEVICNPSQQIVEPIKDLSYAISD